MGFALLRGPNVKRVVVPRFRLVSQMSPREFWESIRSQATLDPSGEMTPAEGMLEGGPTVPSGLPERSNQVSCRSSPATPDLKIRSPLREAENWFWGGFAPRSTFSAIGTASPVV